MRPRRRCTLIQRGKRRPKPKSPSPDLSASRSDWDSIANRRERSCLSLNSLLPAQTLLHTTMSTDDDYDKLSKEEREARDKADREREAAEQAGTYHTAFPPCANTSAEAV